MRIEYLYLTHQRRKIAEEMIRDGVRERDNVRLIEMDEDGVRTYYQYADGTSELCFYEDILDKIDKCEVFIYNENNTYIGEVAVFKE